MKGSVASLLTSPPAKKPPAGGGLAAQFRRGCPVALLNEKAANPASAFKSKTVFARGIQVSPTPLEPSNDFLYHLYPGCHVIGRRRSTNPLRVQHLPVWQLRLCHLQLCRLRLRTMRLHEP